MNKFKYNQELNETEKELAKRVEKFAKKWNFSKEQLDNFIKQRPIMFIAQLTLAEILNDKNNINEKHYVLIFYKPDKEYELTDTYAIQTEHFYYYTKEINLNDFIFYKLW